MLMLATIKQTPRGYRVAKTSKRSTPNAVVCSVCGEALGEVWKTRSGKGFVWCCRTAGAVGTKPTRDEALAAARAHAMGTHECSGGEGTTNRR